MKGQLFLTNIQIELNFVVNAYGQVLIVQIKIMNGSFNNFRYKASLDYILYTSEIGLSYIS